MRNFQLKDYLQHQAYSWPTTLLTYRMQGKMPIKGEDALLMDDKAIPFDVLKMDQENYDLKFMCDLPTEGNHEFRWEKSKDIAKTVLSQEGLSNGEITVTSIAGGLFTIQYKRGAKFLCSVQGDLDVESVEESIVGEDVEKTLTKTLKFTDGSIYKISVKLKYCLDYIEIYEDMSNCKDNVAKLVINWTGFFPKYRYTLDRKREKIGEYLREDGSFPFYINPLVPRCSYWDQRFASYVDKDNFWFGVLLHDLNAYDDKEYAIWSARNKLSLRLYPNQIQAPIADGSRAFMLIFSSAELTALENHYLRYYSMVSLNKVKDWTLAWRDDKNEYPKYFHATKNTEDDYWFFNIKGVPQPEHTVSFVEDYSRTIRQLEKIEPTHCRSLLHGLAPLFDLTAAEMKDEDFEHLRAVMAFCCYVLSSEDYYPIENMLAGHPNFLADVAGVVGTFAGLLGKNHPDFDKWLLYYNKAIARNFKYHVRPDVDVWGAKGGRWTENVGCYMFAMLRPVLYSSALIYHTTGRLPLTGENYSKFLQFFISIQSPENENGRRIYPPQGAHAATGEFGEEFGHGFCIIALQMAELSKYYNPLFSEYIFYNYKREEDVEKLLSDKTVLGATYRKFLQEETGTPPDLHSEKFTGYGYVLRSHVNTDEEMQVLLQQIDEGPNYRWGRAAQGGCGELYYYANHQKYTDHAPEDVGDENRGDVQSCTNFGVLIGYEFRSVGRNDLTEPLIDLDFVQYARVNASDYSQPYYKYRSVLMVENQYIVVYDAVADGRQLGRFTWAQNKRDKFPSIWNLKPGVVGQDGVAGTPIDDDIEYSSKYEQCRTKVYQGRGDFLTVVSHVEHNHADSPLVRVVKMEDGCEVEFAGYKDVVFNDQADVDYADEKYAFIGNIGFIREYHKKTMMAVIDGKEIAAQGVKISLEYDKSVRRAISAVSTAQTLYGKISFEQAGSVTIQTSGLQAGQVWLDGERISAIVHDDLYTFMVPEGRHIWNIGSAPKLSNPHIQTTRSKESGFYLTWNNVAGAMDYKVQIRRVEENEFVTVKTTQCNSLEVEGLKQGKYYVKVCATNDLYESESSMYPVYVTSEIPHSPDGFLIEKRGEHFIASWGKVLGVDCYKLYKVGSLGSTMFYEGNESHTIVPQGEYFVVAVNGNGESLPSLSCSTENPIALWDHHPEKGFVRDTRENEHGYAGFNFINNFNKPILDYPTKK